MKNIFEDIGRIKKHLGKKYIALFLDYDGTLAPIAKTPKQAVLPLVVKQVLRGLAENSRCAIIVISGRSLRDIKEMVGLPGIIYGGNHGMEIEGTGAHFRCPSDASYKRLLKRISIKLHKKLRGYKGVLLEDKGLSLAVHYRQLPLQYIEEFKGVFIYVIASSVLSGRIRIDTGKKVFEIKPPYAWDKGKAVLWILKHHSLLRNKKNIAVMYIGDDRTDEDAFRVLAEKGLTVVVGKRKNSQAHYYINNSEEVCALLRYILKAVSPN